MNYHVYHVHTRLQVAQGSWLNVLRLHTLVYTLRRTYTHLYTRAQGHAWYQGRSGYTLVHTHTTHIHIFTCARRQCLAYGDHTYTHKHTRYAGRA